jgi:predicted ATPase/DNA-binding SARP family transcriptional activator
VTASLPDLDAREQATGPALDIRLLGPVEVWRDGQPQPIGGRRQRTLLALLAIEPGRTAPVDRLVDEVWAGDASDGAPTSLKVYVSRLRSTLGASADLAFVQSGYRLQVPPDSVDSVRFERLLGSARRLLHRRHAPRPAELARAAELARTALDLWRGPVFGGLAESGVLRTQADRLEELRLEATEVRLEAELALGRSSEVVAELEALVAEHPFRERFWRQLMLALYRADRQADALAAYHRARRVLDDELGVEPGSDLRDLEGAILRHQVPDAATALPATHDLPAPLTTFIGRHVEIEEIGRLLREMRLVTLTGVGGVGKTRLAIEAGRAALPERTDGAWFVDLAQVSAADLVASEVAAALGVPEHAAHDAPDRLVEHLRDLDALIILDNCEHVLDPCAALVSRLLARCPGVRILATSRVPLGLDGEAAYTVPPLSTSGVRDGGRSEAAELLLARARAARPRLAVTADEMTAAEQICADLDGLPLAIELAAARVRALSLADIAGRLESRLRFLVSWRRLASARHRTMREALDWSYDLLAPGEQQLFRELSVFAGGFTLAAVTAVCLDGDDLNALDLVERLVDASLITAHPGGDATRYEMLEILREYGTEKLDEANAGAALRKRHAAYFVALVEAPANLVERELSLLPLARLDPERRNLRSALAELEAAGDADAALRICAALWRYWWLRGALAEGRSNLDRAIARTAEVQSSIRGRALRGASTLASRQGDAAAAERYALEAVALSRAIGDEAGLAQGLMAVGNALADQGEYRRAAEQYDGAATILRQGEPTRDLAVLLLNQGSLALNLGDLDMAEAAASESLAHARAASDDAGISINLTTLAMVALARRDPTRARALLDEALPRAAGLGAVEWLMSALVVNAAAELDLGRIEQAAEDLGLADRLRDEIGATLDGEALQAVYRRLRIDAEAALGPETFARRVERGRSREVASRLEALQAPSR